MELEKKVKMVQTFYAGALADSVLRYGNEGILEKVTEQKRREQMAAWKFTADRLEIRAPEEAVTKISEIFNCADWTVEKNENGFTAEAKSCMLCAMAKRLGAKSPCRIYCLDPLEAIVKGLEPASSFDVEETLYEGGKCRIRAEKK